jgi:hypothetical protein
MHFGQVTSGMALTSSRGCLWRASAVFAAAGVFVGIAPTVNAVAAGNSSLQAEIVRDPLSHGVALGSGYLSQLVSGMQRAEDNAVGAAASVSVAALGWAEPNHKSESLIVALNALSWPGHTASDIEQNAALAAKSAAATVCAGALGSPPKVDTPVSKIPNSHFFQCDRGPNGVIRGLTTARDNVFALLLSNSSTLSRKQLEKIGLRQYRALHSPEAYVTT